CSTWDSSLSTCF
nr:immunoglobulin light chain junction region [Macaca mulatta]